ncbi:hypothetical protein HMPREF9120_01141 [Neisseria sp. oral taxon 020 str. F0370]|nr:hypothetical protein HMPREF9120_01141 [Neisseria sp. oral taxon 020 str. F0370]
MTLFPFLSVGLKGAHYSAKAAAGRGGLLYNSRLSGGGRLKNVFVV